MPDQSEHSNQNPSAAETSDSVNLQELVLNLNFVPTWARKPSSGANPYGGESGARIESNRDRREAPREMRRERKRDFRDRDRSPRGTSRDRDGGRRTGAPEGGRGHSSEGRHYAPREERVYLPLEISFIPDRDRLTAVVRQLHAVKRAFPLPYLAGFFLQKPEHHHIKIEARPGREGGAMQLFQCRETKEVFLSLSALNEYLVRVHLDRHFDRIEQAVEPPTGNFVCVGRCQRTGALLGPPNYHAYNERLMEIHRAHFPHMPLDEYRNHVEMVKDPAVIERWKEECRSQVRYRPKDTPEAEATMTLIQAEAMFLEKYASGYHHFASRVILPATAAHQITDEKLRQTIHAAWTREDRFPLSLMLALRPAFRRMRLHLFKTGKGETYVTAIPPKPLDAEHAIPSIKEMISLIAAHPGWNRNQLAEKLVPGKAMDDPDVVEQMSPLAWLIDKGHIIEFFNGTYAIPGHLRAPSPPDAESK